MGKIISIVITVGLVVILAIKAISFYNTSIGFEEQLSAIHTDTQNVLSKVTKTRKFQGFTVGKYSDDIVRAIDASMSGRYGETGAKGAMLWIKEQNPEIDSSIYKQLNQVIEAGYTEFTDIQTRKLDVVRAYNTYLKSFPNNAFAYVLSFPKRDLDELSKIVTDKHTTKAFETGEEEIENPFK